MAGDLYWLKTGRGEEAWNEYLALPIATQRVFAAALERAASGPSERLGQLDENIQRASLAGPGITPVMVYFTDTRGCRVVIAIGRGGPAAGPHVTRQARIANARYRNTKDAVQHDLPLRGDNSPDPVSSVSVRVPFAPGSGDAVAVRLTGTMTCALADEEWGEVDRAAKAFGLPRAGFLKIVVDDALARTRKAGEVAYVDRPRPQESATRTVPLEPLRFAALVRVTSATTISQGRLVGSWALTMARSVNDGRLDRRGFASLAEGDLEALSGDVDVNGLDGVASGARTAAPPVDDRAAPERPIDVAGLPRSVVEVLERRSLPVDDLGSLVRHFVEERKALLGSAMRDGLDLPARRATLLEQARAAAADEAFGEASRVFGVLDRVDRTGAALMGRGPVRPTTSRSRSDLQAVEVAIEVVAGRAGRAADPGADEACAVEVGLRSVLAGAEGDADFAVAVEGLISRLTPSSTPSLI